MSNKVELEIDPDDVLTGADEVERQRQINIFVMTARELYKEDGVDALTDIEVSKWLLGNGGHKGKALAALSETLQWRRDFNVDSILTEDFMVMEKSGRLQYFGNALDGSCIIVWNGSKYVGPKTDIEREKEMRFIVYFIESGRKSGYSGMRADKEDVKLASYIVPILQKHYPERLSRIPAALYEWISRENYFKRFGGLANDPFEDPESAKQVEKDSAPTQKVLKTNAVADVKVVEELWSAPLEYQDV
ncbi:hypothetical protein HDV04_002997 [Boothiomyces sp. JEL0838]|nr:hypothetical protein HDV04_002997 [Boothiomyces sp. JEL0838]